MFAFERNMSMVSSTKKMKNSENLSYETDFITHLESIESVETEQIKDLAIELYDILRVSDIKGSILQYLIAQSASSYLARIDDLIKDGDEVSLQNRELLFLNEMERLRKRFFVPESSQMYNTAKQYFNTIKCGTNIVLFTNMTFEEIKQFCTTRKLTLIVIEDLSEGMECTIISFLDKEFIQTVPIREIDFDDINIKYDIFKQIIAPPKQEVVEEQQKVNNQAQAAKPAKKPSKKTPSKSPKGQSSSLTAELGSSFARDAMKLNNPEFQKFISDLDETFTPIASLLPENDNENVLILSSDPRVHETPFECINIFTRYQVILRDYSIASAMRRTTLSSQPPSYGMIN